MLTIVERFTTLGEAEAAVTALDAGGIEVTLFDDEFVAVNWMISNAVGGVKVVIREEDYDAAADILDFAAEEAQEPDEEAVEPPPSTEVPRCPACGLDTITTLRKLPMFFVLAALLYGVGLAVNRPALAGAAIIVLAIVLMAAPRHRCTSCGEAFTWQNADESTLPPDLSGEQCPRCGSPGVHRIYYRRIKALALFQPLTLFVLAVWPFLPKRACDACGRKSY